MITNLPNCKTSCRSSLSCEHWKSKHMRRRRLMQPGKSILYIETITWPSVCLEMNTISAICQTNLLIYYSPFQQKCQFQHLTNLMLFKFWWHFFQPKDERGLFRWGVTKKLNRSVVRVHLEQLGPDRNDRNLSWKCDRTSPFVVSRPQHAQGSWKWKLNWTEH